METNKRIEKFSRMVAKMTVKMDREGLAAEAAELTKVAQAMVERMRKAG